jgi:hypothetical protein
MLFVVGTTLVLADANLISKLVFELEVSTFLDTLKLHAFEHAVVFVCHELGFEELSDRLEGLSLEFPAHRNKLVALFLWNDT